jgi:hypothetical protein
MILLLALLLVLLFAGFGFVVHLLWIVAVVLLVLRAAPLLPLVTICSR